MKFGFRARDSDSFVVSAAWELQILRCQSRSAICAVQCQTPGSLMPYLWKHEVMITSLTSEQKLVKAQKLRSRLWIGCRSTCSSWLLNLHGFMHSYSQYVHVCMLAYVHACMHACMLHTSSHTCILACPSICLHTCTCAGARVCVCVCVCVCPSVCPSVLLSVCPSVRLSVCPSVRLSVCPSVRLSVCPSVRLSVCLSVCLSLSVCLPVSLYV